ncbi:MAG: NAD(P)/FAD-dependent oxidoreductase [Candidatus Peribacteraceae bacterium]|nr:NAD(P)/FAD-dependent oxidoreductase [Candidatus Peribacteraceae bacterium]
MKDGHFDVAVIGGGPAGMMAAGRAAEKGASVVLLEQNAALGKKLLLTGGGRCNILHAEFDTHRLVEKFGKKGKALYSTFSQLDAQATWDFFVSRGLPLKVEEEQRAFPTSDRAEDVLRTMVRYMAAGNVQVRTDAAVTGLKADGRTVTGATLRGGEIGADRYIIATGGTSHPETGSTGEGLGWMRTLGHTVNRPDPALVPVKLKDTWIPDLAGVSLHDVKLTVMQDGNKKHARTGKMLFTHAGVSGPLVLNMSKGIGELLREGDVTLHLDLFPALDPGALDAQLLSTFDRAKNKLLKNTVGIVVQPRLGHVILNLLNIPADKPLHQLTREERLAFVRLLKALPLHVAGLMGAEEAIVAGGGVDLREIEFKTMRSKLYDNLYLTGDILDFDRRSGGFSLQICWTTGYVAGTWAAARQK